LTKNPHVALSEFNRVATNPIVHPGAQTQALIEYKANVNAVDDMQETPLHKACVKSGNYKIVTRSLSDFLIGFVQKWEIQYRKKSRVIYHGISWSLIIFPML
jgi:hypothetical protein